MQLHDATGHKPQALSDSCSKPCDCIPVILARKTEEGVSRHRRIIAPVILGQLSASS